MKPERLRELYYQHLMAHLPKGVLWYWPDPPFFTGYDHPILYDWDQYFEAISLVYAGYPCDYVKNGVKAFLRQQREDGFIPRFILATLGGGRWVAPDMVKPFLAHNVLLCHHQEGSLAWLTQGDHYDRLCRYLDHWLHKQDRRGGGLSAWMHAGHSGMDNQHERAGGRTQPEFISEGVDLNCYLVREARAMSIIAGLLGKEDDRQRFAGWADARARTIRETCWDARDGFFYDHHVKEDRAIRVKSVGAFATLWAGVATPEQAAVLVRDHLLNEKEFDRPWPVPALAASEPGYVLGYQPGDSTGCSSWRAHTWVPSNYYVIHGLQAYGFRDEAARLAQKTGLMFERAPFCEYYCSESGIGTGLRPFRGWSALALFVEKELEMGLDPTALSAENSAGRAVRAWFVQNY